MPLATSKNLACFNPRTHTGCDVLGFAQYIRFRVSIHAPTRGATDENGSIEAIQDVSIHAPTRGATIGI